MTCHLLAQHGTWADVRSAALATEGKEPGHAPSVAWIRRMVRAEHSPIRIVSFIAEWQDLPYWVSVHLTRHKIGVEHWVKSQRPDRTGKARGNQDDPVTHRIQLNVQALVNISRKRCCYLASPETREAWGMLVDAVVRSCPELYGLLVPDCVYRGKCREYRRCDKMSAIEHATRMEAYEE